MKNQTKKFFLDKLFLFNILFIILYSIMKDIRLFRPFKTFFSGLLLLLIFVGCINIIVNFYKIKFKSYFFNIGLLFSITILASSIIMSNLSIDAIKESLITSYCVLGIMFELNNMDRENIIEFRYKALKIIIFIIGVFTFLSNFLFLSYGPISVNILNYNFILGSVENRMFGLFESITVPISASNIVLALIFKNLINFNSNKEDLYVYYLSIISSIIYISLSYSYGIILSVAISIAIYCFFINYSNRANIAFNIIISLTLPIFFIRVISLLRRILFIFLEVSLLNTDNGISMLLNILLTIFIFFIVFILVKYNSKINKIFCLREQTLTNIYSRKIQIGKIIIFIFILIYIFLSLIFPKYSIAKSKNLEKKEYKFSEEIFEEEKELGSKKEIEKILKVDKNEQDGILTGRDKIWKYGFEKLSLSPLIGYGLGAFEGETILGSQRLQHFHSVFVQGLVSGGIIHFIFLILLLSYVIYRYLKHLFTNRLDKNYKFVVAIFSFIILMGLNGIIETSFLYINRFSQYITWFIIGISTINLYETKK